MIKRRLFTWRWPMPPLSHLKLTRLAELEGFRTKEALLHAYISEIIVPGICMNPGCDYNAQVAFDEREGHCQREGTLKVQW